MIARRQKIISTGPSSHAIIIPAPLLIGKEATLAVSRLMLVDLRGEISEQKLGKLLEDVLEPALYRRTSNE
jgi:hypothetical protein